MELNENHQPSKSRETLLTVMLTILCGGGFVTFLIFASLGFFVYVFLAVAAIAGLGYFHYLLWGQALTDEVADEQAHDAALEQQQLEQQVPRTAIRRKRF